MSRTLYARVADDVGDYLDRLAENSHLSLTKTIETLARIAQAEGWDRIDPSPQRARPAPAVFRAADDKSRRQ